MFEIVEVHFNFTSHDFVYFNEIGHQFQLYDGHQCQRCHPKVDFFLSILIFISCVRHHCSTQPLQRHQGTGLETFRVSSPTIGDNRVGCSRRVASRAHQVCFYFLFFYSFLNLLVFYRFIPSFGYRRPKERAEEL